MNSKADRLKGGLSKLAQAASAHKDSVSGTIILIKPSDCYEKDNPRQDFDQDLIESYAEDFLDPNIGQEEAIQLYPADENGKYRVQHGATRLRAGLIAEAKNPGFRLKAIVVNELAKKDELENYLNRGMNNIKRNNMSLRDRANFVGNCMDMAKESGKSLTQADVAKRLGLKGGATYVSRLLKLRDMTPELNEVYMSGKIDDIEALATLAEIQKENPELFGELISLTDLDRATIRLAKKTGRLTDSGSEPANRKETDETYRVTDDAENVKFRPTEEDAVSDESVTTIPYVAYLFKTGRVNILVKPVQDGYLSALETIFDHGINEDGNFTDEMVWNTEDEAFVHAVEKIPAWAEKVISDKDAVSIEEYQDVAGYLNWLKTGVKQQDTSTQKQEPVERKPKPSQLNAVVFVDVNGEEGILLLKVPKDYIGTDGHNVNTSGFVYVQIGTEIRVVKDGEYVITSISYRE